VNQIDAECLNSQESFNINLSLFLIHKNWQKLIFIAIYYLLRDPSIAMIAITIQPLCAGKDVLSGLPVNITTILENVTVHRLTFNKKPYE